MSHAFKGLPREGWGSRLHRLPQSAEPRMLLAQRSLTRQRLPQESPAVIVCFGVRFLASLAGCLNGPTGPAHP